MEIIGQQVIQASRAQVWKALNDPVVLKACLPGCESVDQTSSEEFQVVIKAVIGPMRARFKGVLRLSDVNEPASCVMHFEGQGAPVGFGKGQAKVTLSETPEGTLLAYEAKAMVGGSLAQVGSRLLDSVIKKMSDDFFKAFRQQLSPPDPISGKAQAPVVGHQAGAFMPASSAEENLAPERAQAVREDAAIMVPAWWLAPAAVLGALLAISGSHWIR